MFVIAVGLGVFGLFLWLSESARKGSRQAMEFAAVEAALLMAAGALGVFLAVVLRSLSCDESCEEVSSDWWHTDNAWQWDAQLAVAVIGFAALAAALWNTMRNRHRRASASMALAAAAFAAWAVFLAPLGNEFGI